MIALIELINRLLVDFGDRRSVHLDTIRLIYQTLWISVYKPCVQFPTRNVDGRRDMYISCIDCLMLSKIISKQTNRAISELWRRYEQTDRGQSPPHMPLSEPMMVSISNAYTRHSAKLTWTTEGNIKFTTFCALQWLHNEHDGVSNHHQPHDCLLNRLFRRRSNKTWKLRVTGLCEGNSPVTGEFPAQRASSAKMFPFDDVMMTLSNHVIRYNVYKQVFGWGE